MIREAKSHGLRLNTRALENNRVYSAFATLMEEKLGQGANQSAGLVDFAANEDDKQDDDTIQADLKPNPGESLTMPWKLMEALHST
jgi:hypothetical protein